MTCDGAQIIFITKGHYGKVPLEGLAVGQFVQSPEHQSMFESFGKWNFDYIYIDEKANEQQREALKELSLHFFPGFLRTGWASQTLHKQAPFPILLNTLST